MSDNIGEKSISQENELPSDQELIEAAEAFANEVPAPDISLDQEPQTTDESQSFVQLADFVKKEHQKKKFLSDPKVQVNVNKFIKYEQAKPENILFSQKGLQINKAA